MGGRGGTSHRASGGGLPKTLARFAEFQRAALTRLSGALSRADQMYLQGQLQQLFAQNDFGMRIRSELLERVLGSHFKNQFETHSSQGALDQDLRNRAAENLFGVDASKLKPSEHEKYGYLVSRDKEAAMSDYMAAQYGDAVIRFKREAVIDRLTYTVGDSLFDATQHQLIAGSVKNASITGFPGNINDYLTRVRRSEPFVGSAETWASHVAYDYLELQYHGALTMSDVASVTFSDITPRGFTALVEKLKKKGISVWQVKGGRAREL